MGCGIPPVLTASGPLPDVMEASQIPETRMQIADTLDFSLTASVSASMSMHMQRQPVFAAFVRKTDAYAAPKLHQVACEYLTAGRTATFFGAELEGLEVLTGTVLCLHKLENFSQYVVDSFVNQLVLSVNLPDIFTRTLDFQPQKMLQGVEQVNYSVDQLIQHFHQLPIHLVRLVVKNVSAFIIYLQQFNIISNGIAPSNVAIKKNMGFSLQNLFASSRVHASPNVPYCGINEAENIVNLVTRMCYNTCIFFQFKSLESLLIYDGECCFDDYFTGDIEDFVRAVGASETMQEVADHQFVRDAQVSFITELTEIRDDVEFKEERVLQQFLDGFRGQVAPTEDFTEGVESQVCRGFSEAYFGRRACEGGITF
ncbi:hypothetical protein SS50377_27108 [Spironucleus salmonicida]|uniref:Uncharacterized protein n=1 Tax=Spironucleus salmonicida TaxID=348837 RepID=A0A9P8RVR7_9EUKA|nr:hypothetical protein SS50377_27108 [Spironucleus salmonicida]